MKNEIIIYRSPESKISVDVMLMDDTFWLTQKEIAKLFGVEVPAISKHFKKIFESKELIESSVVSKMETTASDGKNYITSYYSLDAIIAVGYRVNSYNATQFRIWATNVLKEYLLKGYALNNRMNRLEDSMVSMKTKIDEIDFHISSKLLPTQGIFFDGQVFDAYKLVSEIIRSASRTIVLIDNYIDENTLTILSKKENLTKVILLTKSISKQLELDVKKANEQYGNYELRVFSKSHDRFLIIDNTEIYHLGASLKDLGRKWFAFSKMDKSSVDSILKAIDELK